MTTIAERIRNRRQELGMSQDELARLLGYKSRSSIYKIEASGQDLPRKKIEKIAEALHTTPEYIMGWEEKPKEEKIFQFSQEASEKLSRTIKNFSDAINPNIRVAFNNSKITELILKAMAELDEKDQSKVLNYAETLKESKSYREYVKSLQKHPKKR